VAGSARAESVRRVVELTGLGIAATYFLDPNHGSARRRAAWGWVVGARSDRVEPQPPPAALELAPEPEPEPADVEPHELAQEPGELVLVSGEGLTGAAPEQGAQWPTWGWALVLTITVCALAAFAAVGLGIWAIKHRTTETRTVTAPVTSAAPVLADPTARRVIGTATQGHVILRLDDGAAALAVDALPPPGAGRRYRVWITNGGTTSAAGGFAGRRAILTLRPIASGSRVTITREPAAAPPAPSGPQVASVTVP
jgi:hypothetical protein